MHPNHGRGKSPGQSLVETDTGSLDLSSAQLNGLDDLHPPFPPYVGPRDLELTHNFVIWGGNGATGYTRSMSIGPEPPPT